MSALLEGEGDNDLDINVAAKSTHFPSSLPKTDTFYIHAHSLTLVVSHTHRAQLCIGTDKQLWTADEEDLAA